MIYTFNSKDWIKDLYFQENFKYIMNNKKSGILDDYAFYTRDDGFTSKIEKFEPVIKNNRVIFMNPVHIPEEMDGPAEKNQSILKKEIEILKKEIEILKKEIDILKNHPYV